MATQKSNDHTKEWKTIDSLVNKGLTQSALKEVDNLYKIVKAEGNQPQIVKVIIYKSKLVDLKEEDSYIKIFKIVDDEILTAQAPLKNILHSIQAELLWRYYSSNRYKFLNRSTTIDFKNDDIATWDVKTLVAKIADHYLLSLEKSDILKTTKIEDYNAILTLEKGSSLYRPTLYDFLVQRAIDYFSNDEPSISHPLDAFKIDNPGYFCLPEDFIKINFSTSDSLSFKYYALKIMQEVVKFHINNYDLRPLIDIELKRLNYIKNNAEFDDKDSLYFKTLLKLEDKYKKDPAVADVSYQIANQLYIKGTMYKPLQSDDYKWEIKKALEKCNAVVESFPKTDGVKNCMNLIDRIKSTSIALICEAFVPSQKQFLGLVTYTNASKLYLRIIPANYQKIKEERNKYKSTQAMLNAYISMKFDKSFTYDLVDDKDYQSHSTEIALPELKKGYYIILASDNKDFSFKDGDVAYSTVMVTDLSYLTRRSDEGIYHIFVMNRNDGSPLANAKIQTYSEEYNSLKRIYETKKWKSFETNQEGFVEIPSEKNANYRNFNIEITTNDDFICSERDFYQYNYNGDYEKPKITSHFFIDRAIYRPGQTVYFKGLILESNGDEKVIKPNYPTKVTLYDVNSQEVSSLNLRTNEFGSFTGTFTLPTGVLTGAMSIRNESGNQYFNVEEYKRPKFEVAMEPIKGLYKLNDNIKAKGKATAYAGSSIDNADVKYRVVRTTRYPYYIYGWRWAFPTSAEVVVKTGVVKTDASGTFNIDFLAVPDNKVNKKFKPVFNYTIYADVTDITGETRSTVSSLYVGYTALLVDMTIPNIINKNDFKPLKISSTNLNYENESTSCQIKISRLKNPEQVYREKLWPRSDKKIISAADYKNLFPKDIYDNENDYMQWEKEKPSMDITAVTEKEKGKVKEISIDDIKNWKSGKYIVEVKAKDTFGETVEKTYYFTLYGSGDKKTPVNDIFWVDFPDKEYEPGENVVFSIGSAEKGINLIYEIEHKGKIIKREWISLNEEVKSISIPVTEDYRGNFTVHFAFVKDNRQYTYNENISVPFTNKMLDIEYATFRDKLNPGQKEEWKIIIKDKKGEKMLAELLTTMYDASLDAFSRNYWFFNILNYNNTRFYWDNNKSFKLENAFIFSQKEKIKHLGTQRGYDVLDWFGFYFYGWGNYYYKGEQEDAYLEREETTTTAKATRSVNRKMAMASPAAPGKDGDTGANFESDQKEIGGFAGHSGEKADKSHEGENGMDYRGGDAPTAPVQIRTNFNETAFFYPQLTTNENGEVVVSFTVPESLTKWRIMSFAHTKDLKYGTMEKELVTQKDLMVMPNAPRFFREGDKIQFSAKVSNLSDKELNGTAQLQLFDAVTMQPIDGDLQNTKPVINFNVKAGESAPLYWDLFIKEGTQAITYRIIAKAGNFSDGEENAIPVLSNRMLVTETLPLPIRGKSEKTFNFEKLINSKNSTTLRNHKLTLEFTSNPAWYAIQALPYLIEYPYECSEQIFSRYYANSIASHIANSNPKIKKVFESWQNITPDALLSNLEKNQELKSVMLQETPWLLNGKNESERKKHIALLFDMNKMANERERALKQLLQNQLPNGGWPWFKGMPDDRYITQYIVEGIGKLNRLNVDKWENDTKLKNAVTEAVRYIDDRLKEDYEYLKKYYSNEMGNDHLSSFLIHYLYTRSFYTNIEIKKTNKEAFDYFFGQAKRYWNNKNRYEQGMIALALNRYNELKIPADIVQSLTENAITSDEMGMYWKDNRGGYYWFQAPIETQSLLIEVYDEVAKDPKAVDELKIWLLKQKQTQDWKTTKATAEAIYALILKGTDFLASEQLVEITLGSLVVDPKKLDDVKVEAGTGYFKTSWSGNEIKPEMGVVKVKKSDDGIAWGAVYWQYFEQLDKITSAETPLKLTKKVFVEESTPAGLVIKPVGEGSKLKVGDKLKIRIELRVDRDMEYVHMKDMRASGFEPVNVISQYKYQDGLGYYESTGDAATNFFISYLSKGTYVFEYPLFVTHKGDFSNGITSIQCMYAPEFTAHSEGIRVVVE